MGRASSTHVLPTATWDGSGGASRTPHGPRAFGAQPLLGPSRHFGAGAIPSPRVGAHLGVSLDSFTEFNNDADDDGAYLRIPYNAIDETIGLNFLNYS